MSGTNYSQDQIEEKRLLALRRKAEKESKNNNSPGSSKDNSKNVFRQNISFQGNLNNFRVEQENGPKKEKSWEFMQFAYDKSPGPARTPKSNNRMDPIKPQNFFSPSEIANGICSMYTESRFYVNVEFNPKLIAVFRTIPSRLYDQQIKRWSFHIIDYDKLMSNCMQLRPHIIISGIPSYVLQIFKKKMNKKKDTEITDLSTIDSKLTSSLMPFQQDGVRYGISKEGRCFIADDMGLGKTIQALGLAHYYRENWPLLIVTPSSVRFQWSEAIYKFLPSVPTQYVQHFTSSKDFVGEGKITIVTYDLLVKSLDLFQHRTFGFVILDESHTVKSSKAARTRAVQCMASQARHVVLLSGTPALSRPIELYSQISLIMPSFMGHHDYGVRYCAGVKKAFGWDYSGSSNLQELQLVLRACCLIRRLKVDVLKQLPDKMRQVVILDPILIKKASQEAQLMAEKLNSKTLKNSERKNAILKYYHESSSQRLKAVCDYVSDVVEKRQKFLIFAHHQNVLEAISQLLISKKIKFIRIDGKTLAEQRKHQIDLFQDSDDYLVAVLSVTAANSGITLTAAKLVIFAELFWNPGILCQAEDRVHRIGQSKGVVIQYLVAKGTVDDHLWPLIQRKIEVLSKVGLDQNFCLDNADVSEQKITEKPLITSKKKQMKIDSFVTVTASSSSQAIESQKNEEEKVIETIEDFDDFFIDNDDDFAEIELVVVE